MSKRPESKLRNTDQLVRRRYWLAYAESVAVKPVSQGGSPHPSVKIGAVFVDKRNKKLTEAANRFAYGVDRRRPERYKNGTKSLWINCAEQLAIAQALRKSISLKDAKLYVTLEPCAVCAGLIAESGVKEVFVPIGAMRRYAKLKSKWKDSIEIGLTKLAESGVRLTSIDTDAVK
jgi:tRNA(Arg) A34 adenosine deaminase TadA